jgi:hypothetical protein
MPVLEWYRPLPARRMGKVVAWGVSSLIVGTVMVGMAAYDRNVLHAWRPVLGVAGGLLVAGGPVTLLVGFHQLLFRDNWFLAVRLDGVQVRLPSLQVVIPWDELERAHTSADGALELRTKRTVYRVTDRFAGHEPVEIARRIDSARRRILHGLPVTGGTS